MSANRLNVSIASDVDIDDVTTLSAFPYTSIVDFRFDHGGKARPVCEQLLKRLTRFWAGYEQCPTDLAAMTDTQEELLLSRLKTTGDDVLIITDQIAEFISFCDFHGIFHRTARLARPRLRVIEGKQTQTALSELDRQAS